ncbi:MAG: GDP-mannose 4,6-dehydratase [Planctomycetales bacterium]|nr:GDP-mannose 4,6-dehydratase [Planctomycetales bacterium]
MNALVTGGAGFIGSHLVERLLADGARVEVLDDLSTGSIENLDGVRANPRLKVHVDSIENGPVLSELVDRCDTVFHLAAAVGVRLIVESPVRTIETNIRGTEILLERAAVKRKKVLLASTSEVYGKGVKVPFSEDDDVVLGPTTKSRWSYACSKAVDEFLALSYAKEKKLPVVIVRLFNTVGPRQVGHYGMVVPRFVEQALAGGPLTVYGDGEQSRCFCDVSDVVEALVRLVATPAAEGRVFNVGSDREISIQGLAERVVALVNPGVAIERVPYDQAYEAGFEDLRRRVPDLARIGETIGWKPTKSLDEIIGRVEAHLRGKRGAAGDVAVPAAVPPAPAPAPATGSPTLPRGKTRKTLKVPAPRSWPERAAAAAGNLFEGPRSREIAGKILEALHRNGTTPRLKRCAASGDGTEARVELTLSWSASAGQYLTTLRWRCTAGRHVDVVVTRDTSPDPPGDHEKREMEKLFERTLYPELKDAAG